MRLIGRLSNENDARRFVAYLLQNKVDALVQNEAEEWLIWVRSEDQLDVGRSQFDDFLAHPSHPRYQQIEKNIPAAAQRPTRASGRRRVSWRQLFGDPEHKPDVILAVLYISMFVTAGSWLPAGSISDTLTHVLEFADSRDPVAAKDPFESLEQGQIWRVFTPIFLHSQWHHLLIYSVFVYYLGGQIERLRGPLAVALLIIITAIFSNTAQAYFAGPGFGGLGGVMYGLLGYLLIKSSYDPGSGFVVPLMILLSCLSWFLLCLFVERDEAANYAHVAGLVTGMVIALAPSRRDEPPSEGVV